jgi:hypothetical protein
MMSKRLLSAFAVLLTACATANAQSTILLGNFEGTPNTGQTDGWTGQNGTTLQNFNFPSAATLGSGAMSVVAGTNFIWCIRLDNNARPTLGADILSHPLLKADVTWVTSQWTDSTPSNPDDNWAKWDHVAVNDNTGWEQKPATGDTSNPSFPGSWDTNNYGATNTRTLTWDMSSFAIDTSGFVQLWISTNMSSTSFPQGGRFWIDNIRLESNIPEPATLALGGMALLGLGLRRRK